MHPTSVNSYYGTTINYVQSHNVYSYISVVTEFPAMPPCGMSYSGINVSFNLDHKEQSLYYVCLVIFSVCIIIIGIQTIPYYNLNNHQDSNL